MNTFEKIMMTIMWILAEISLVTLIYTSFPYSHVLSSCATLVALIIIPVLYGFWKNKPAPEKFDYVLNDEGFDED